MEQQERKNTPAAWIKKTKSGDDYLSVLIEGKWYNLFKNKYKTTEKQPDWKTIEDKKKGASKSFPF